MNKNFLKVMFSEMVRVGTLPLRLLPIKKNRILDPYMNSVLKILENTMIIILISVFKRVLLP